MVYLKERMELAQWLRWLERCAPGAEVAGWVPTWASELPAPHTAKIVNGGSPWSWVALSSRRWASWARWAWGAVCCGERQEAIVRSL